MDADIIVCTGDLIDMQMDHLDGLGQLMSSLQARYGKYAVLGNHEALAGLPASRRFIERIGFKLLSGSGVSIDRLINLVGVDDPAVAGRFQQSTVDEPALLKRFDNGLYTLLLKHQPVVEQQSTGLFDLQLSGHTHGGQCRLPGFGAILTSSQHWKRYEAGLYRADDTTLYVSRGLGMEGFGTPRARFLCPPEVVSITLRGEGP